jgi:hypothetical protein
MSLLSHRGSTFATEAQLEALPPPVSRGPIHQPVPHAQLVGMLKGAALTRGFDVVRGEFALGRKGQRLFGVMDLEPSARPIAKSDHGMSIGFRNSTDESLAITVVAGARVFVCDNLVLSGELIALQRRNTTGLDLSAALLAGFDRYLTHVNALDYQIAQLQTVEVSDLEAKAKIFDIFAQRVLPPRLFRKVDWFYFHPTSEMTDCQPRTLWGVHNACTRVLRELPQERAFTANVALGRVFGLTKQEDTHGTRHH